MKKSIEGGQKLFSEVKGYEGMANGGWGVQIERLQRVLIDRGVTGVDASCSCDPSFDLFELDKQCRSKA